jgi:RNA polymerase sigma-70 factor (ECF subfamily)
MENEDRARYEWIALRCQSGEIGAFEDLIAVMERPLLYYAASLTGSQDSGLDVLQDAWLKSFRDIHKLKDPGSLRPWLYAIVRGIAIDRIRQRYPPSFMHHQSHVAKSVRSASYSSDLHRP